MNEKIHRTELTTLQNDSQSVLKILSSKKKKRACERRIRKYNLTDRVSKLDKYGLDIMMIVPVLNRILESPNMKYFPELASSIVIVLGKLHPDGLVTEYAFTEIVKGTLIKPDEIPKELDRCGYIRNNLILPSFRPYDPNFSFEVDERYFPLKEQIKETLLGISKEYTSTRILTDLVDDPDFESIRSDIIYALTELGHPSCLPKLIELAKNGNKESSLSIIRIAHQDIMELDDLYVRGVRKDLWGGDIKTKVLNPLHEIVPFLLTAIQSTEYTIDDRRIIAEIYSKMDRKRQSEMEVFVKVLPELYVDRIGACPVSRVIAAGGEDSVGFLVRFLDESPSDLQVLTRIVDIFGIIGFQAKSAIPVLDKISKKRPEMASCIEEAIRKIGHSDSREKKREDKRNPSRIGESAIPGAKIDANRTKEEPGPDEAELETIEELEELEEIEEIEEIAEVDVPDEKTDEIEGIELTEIESLANDDALLEIESEESVSGQTGEKTREGSLELEFVDTREFLDDAPDTNVSDEDEIEHDEYIVVTKPDFGVETLDIEATDVDTRGPDDDGKRIEEIPIDSVPEEQDQEQLVVELTEGNADLEAMEKDLIELEPEEGEGDWIGIEREFIALESDKDEEFAAPDQDVEVFEPAMADFSPDERIGSEIEDVLDIESMPDTDTTEEPGAHEALSLQENIEELLESDSDTDSIELTMEDFSLDEDEEAELPDETEAESAFVIIEENEIGAGMSVQEPPVEDTQATVEPVLAAKVEESVVSVEIPKVSVEKEIQPKEKKPDSDTFIPDDFVLY